MTNNISLSWVHAWLILSCAILLGIGATHFYYYLIDGAIEKGITAVMLAILLPSFTIWCIWLFKRHDIKKLFKRYDTKKTDIEEVGNGETI